MHPSFIHTLPLPSRPPPFSPRICVRMRVASHASRKAAPEQLATGLKRPAIHEDDHFSAAPSPADWLRAHEAALKQREASVVRRDPNVAARSGGGVLLNTGLLNLAGGARWLYSAPPSYCSVDGDVEHVVDSLEEKTFYLGPVTRNKVVRAVELARSVATADRFRHNITVALIVADLQMDCDTVCAAVLNGLVSLIDERVVKREVAADVLRILKYHAEVVRSVKLCVDETFTEMSFSNLRELILVGAMEEHRAISLELARAVLQIRTLEALHDEREKICVARRAMFLYAPLANQLGIWFVQGELEELAFMYLQPESFHMVRHLVGERRRECESTLVEAKEFLERVLSSTPQVRSLVRTVLIKGRVKGLYSVYRKMRRSGKEIYEIYDLLALRVVVQPKKADEESEIAACYAVADVIKQHYETFESRAKDYIAAPKRNGYRSLHLTVVPRGGSTPLEIQIRTEKMHHVAEFGQAAHWIYKERSDEEEEEEDREMYDDNKFCGDGKEKVGEGMNVREEEEEGCKTGCGDSDELQKVRAELVRKRRMSGEDVQDQLRKGYVCCMASAIRTSRVIVAAAGQLYGLAVGSTLMDLARGMGVAGLGAIAVVNGSVAPLTQRLEMYDMVRFISALPEA